MKRVSPNQLRRFILDEAQRLSETLEQKKKNTEDVKAKEVDAADLAKTIAKDVNFMKALKIKEGRLKRKLAKITEAKKVLRQRIMKRLR